MHVREPHLHVAGTSFAAILITRLSSGGKHKFRSLFLLLPRFDIDPWPREKRELTLFPRETSSSPFLNRQSVEKFFFFPPSRRARFIAEDITGDY